jgi:hypothetical protein
MPPTRDHVVDDGGLIENSLILLVMTGRYLFMVIARRLVLGEPISLGIDVVVARIMSNE